MFSTTCFAAEKGFVAYIDDYKDLIVVEDEYGAYTVAEMCSGYPYPLEGSRIYGNLRTFGFHEWFCPQTDRTYRVFIDDFLCDEDAAIDWIIEHS